LKHFRLWLTSKTQKQNPKQKDLSRSPTVPNRVHTSLLYSIQNKDRFRNRLWKWCFYSCLFQIKPQKDPWKARRKSEKIHKCLLLRRWFCASEQNSKILKRPWTPLGDLVFDATCKAVVFIRRTHTYEIDQHLRWDQKGKVRNQTFCLIRNK